MKLRSYLRGLGIGIIVTALLLHFTGAPSNEKNVATATEPQDVEVLAEVEPEEISTFVVNKEDDSELKSDVPEEEETSEIAEHITEESKEDIPITIKVKGEETFEESDKVEEMLNTIQKTLDEVSEIETSAEQEPTDDSSDDISSDEEIELAIARGDDSGTVSRKLYNAGLVDNASEFDAYLMQHGYDKKISIGTVKIKKGASWADIAQKLSGN